MAPVPTDCGHFCNTAGKIWPKRDVDMTKKILGFVSAERLFH